MVNFQKGLYYEGKCYGGLARLHKAVNEIRQVKISVLLIILKELNNNLANHNKIIHFSLIMLPGMKKRTFCGSMPEIFTKELSGRFL